MPAPKDINVRKVVIAALKPLLPPKWNVKEFNSLPDTIDRPSVVLVFDSYEKSAGAPRSRQRFATFVLTIVTPKMLPGVADDDLDDIVIELLNAIDDINVGKPPSKQIGLTWSTAKQGVAAGRPGFDITLRVSVKLDNPVQENT